MKSGCIFLFGALLVSACAEPLLSPSPTSDLDLKMAQILGVRVGMTPRKLRDQISGLGFEESAFNNETLQDIVLKSDRGAEASTAQVIFSKGEGTLSALDDVTLTVQFCYGHVDYISISERIPKVDYEKRKARDLKMFPGLVELPRKHERVIFSGNYQPNEFSHSSIAYLDRGYSDFSTRVPVIQRLVSVLEGVGCFNRSVRRELGYY